MQNRYVGDIGDFFKFALLRALQPGCRLGIAWWLYPDEPHKGDGRHISYLQCPSKWRTLDPHLFDGLAQIVKLGNRRISALEDAGFLPGAVYCPEPIPTEGTPAQRRARREVWLEQVRSTLIGCDLVFLDPDNGLENASFSPGKKVSGKSVSLAQLAELSEEGRTLVVYHHHTHFRGGHIAELEYWVEKLRCNGFKTIDAVQARPFSPRVFFMLNASPDLQHRARQLTMWSSGLLSWHSNVSAT